MGEWWLMADKTLTKLAKGLRRQQTDAEKKIWYSLRSRQFQGVKFRRQQPLGPYIVDFCSLQKKVVIELDGGQHATEQEKDAKRTKYLNQLGFRVIRVWNNDVLKNVEGVLEQIQQQLKTPLTPARLLNGSHREDPLCTRKTDAKGRGRKEKK
jgi:very-short-patch-repair endonuclease